VDLLNKSRPAMAAIVTASLIAIPAFVIVALWRVQSIWADAISIVAALEVAPSERGIGTSAVIIDAMCYAGLPDLTEFCNAATNVRYSLFAAYVCLALAVILVALPWLARGFVGTDRSRLARVFSPIVKVMTLSVGILIVVQSIIGSYAFYVWEVEETGRFHPKLLLFGLAGVVVGLVLLAAAMKRLRFDPSYVFGISLSDQEQPRLASEVQTTARRLGAVAPDNTVVGLEPNFFVTSAPVTLLDGTELKGRTLFLSLPLMRLFRPDEFRAVIGHELTHFKGADTEYSQKFAPAYHRLSEALATTADEGIFQSIASMPLAYTLREFAETERTIGRQRELIADQGAAAVSSSSALIGALIKVAMHGPLWSTVVNESETKLAAGTAFSNLSSLYAGAAVDQLGAFDRAKLREALMECRMSHPIDTHPTLAERAAALKCSVDAEIDGAFVSDGESATALFDDLEAVEEAATLVQHRLAVITGRVVLPERDESSQP